LKHLKLFEEFITTFDKDILTRKKDSPIIDIDELEDDPSSDIKISDSDVYQIKNWKTY